MCWQPFAFISALCRSRWWSVAVARTTINLSDEDIELLKALKDHFKAPSLNDAIRQSIAQASVLTRYVNEHGELVLLKDGAEVRLVKT